MEKKPLALRLTPLRLRVPLFYRMFARNAACRPGLFENARLALAPHISLKLSPTDVSHQPIALAGVYELTASRMVVGLARSGGLLVDVGANYGYYSCLWAGLRPQNTVVAFEPIPANVAALRANLERNGLADRVTIHEIAVGRRSGELRFHTGAQGQTGQGGFAGAGERSEWNAAVCALDDRPELWRESIAVLKVDTEGADAWVLEGARGLLTTQRIAHVIFEHSAARMRALNIREDSAHCLLAGCGYALKRVSPEQWHAFLPHGAAGSSRALFK